MSKGKLKIVFVDTNVIIEAHRTGCWQAPAASYDIHTVEAVREESLRRPKGDIDYIPIDEAVFDGNVTVHAVSDTERARAIIEYPELAHLDEGEKDMLACLYSAGISVMLLTTGDTAAIRMACQLGFADQLCALETLARKGSIQTDLKSWYTSKHLSIVKARCMLDNLV
jgi:hypothetical protein